MIPKSSKFPMRTEFLAFRRSAKRLSSLHFTIYWLSRSRNEEVFTFRDRQSRFSVVIPKKVNKRATTRNWLKRLTYNTVWPIIEDNNLDMVIIYKPIKLEKSAETKKCIISELVEQMGTLLNRNSRLQIEKGSPAGERRVPTV